jgi:hypothetical protein
MRMRQQDLVVGDGHVLYLSMCNRPSLGNLTIFFEKSDEQRQKCKESKSFRGCQRHSYLYSVLVFVADFPIANFDVLVSPNSMHTVLDTK